MILQFKCILCGCKLKVRQRRPVNKHLRKYLRRTFLLESSESDFIYGKCSQPAYRQILSPVLHQASLRNGGPESTCRVGIPPSIRLPSQTASKSHAYFLIFKKPRPKVIVVLQQLRTKNINKVYKQIPTEDANTCRFVTKEIYLTTFSLKNQYIIRKFNEYKFLKHFNLIEPD